MVRSFLQPDGSVIVPADVAGELVAAAVRDLTARARRDGLLITDRARHILTALAEAADRHDQAAGSGVGTPPAGPPKVEISTGEAADRLGCSAEYVRRLCRSGAVIARRTGGRFWLIDPESLDRYRYGAGHEHQHPAREEDVRRAQRLADHG